MPEWLTSSMPAGWSVAEVTAIAVGFAVVSAIVSLIVVGYVLARLPADYFVNPAARECQVKRHPINHVLLLIGRNLLGYFLIALGVMLSFPGVPGQGILTILMGVMLINMPGKLSVEAWLVTRRFVLGPVNKLRAKFGQPPLVTTPLATPTSCDIT